MTNLELALELASIKRRLTTLENKRKVITVAKKSVKKAVKKPAKKGEKK